MCVTVNSARMFYAHKQNLSTRVCKLFRLEGAIGGAIGGGVVEGDAGEI